MDWAAIASVLGERTDRPLVILDDAGRIRMFNRAMEGVLGWGRFQVEGQLWVRVCVPPDHELETKRWIAEAARGALRSYDAAALTRSGGRVILRLEFSLVGRGASQGLIMAVTRTIPEPSAKRALTASDLDYEISVIGPDFGSLTRVCADGDDIPIAGREDRCYAVLHGLPRPCEDCPVLQQVDGGWPRRLVRHRRQSGPEGSRSMFEIVSAARLDATVALLRVRRISEDTLEAIHEAKVQELADGANLSQREREVLGYLLLGRSIDDVAKLVGISSRTVKHHQSNVLQKLGADSRADLIRIVF